MRTQQERAANLAAIRATPEGQYCERLMKPFGSFQGRGHCYVCLEVEEYHSHYAGMIVCLPCWIGARR